MTNIKPIVVPKNVKDQSLIIREVDRFVMMLFKSLQDAKDRGKDSVVLTFDQKQLDEFVSTLHQMTSLVKRRVEN